MELLGPRLVAIVSFFILACGSSEYDPKTGDIVFQDLKSPSSGAIKLASDSPYSHCGMVIVKMGGAFVIEAVGPVREIALTDWIVNGGGSFSAMRLKKKTDLQQAVSAAEGYIGKPYDILYEWDDDKLYCSELVYKSYLDGCGIRLCDLRSFESYNIEPVRQAVIARYGSVPEGQMVVTPGDIARSSLLKTVYSNME